MTNVTYAVPNISCGHCVQNIQTKLGQMPGVRSVKADAASKRVEVAFESPATEETIKSRLTEIRFPVAP